MRNSLPQRYLSPFADVKILFLNISGLFIGLSICSRQFYNYDFFKGNSLFKKNVVIYFWLCWVFLALLFTWAFSSCGKQALLIAVLRLLTAVSSCGAQALERPGFSVCSTQAL